MKILHFFPYEKFTMPYIDFVNSNYNPEDHLFVLYGNHTEYPIKSYGNVIKYESKIYMQIIILKYLFKSKRIIVHSLNGYLALLLTLQPWLLKKSFWVVWGGDLYYFKKKAKGLKNKVMNAIKIIGINRMKGICTLVKGDFNIAKELFRLKGEYYPAAYINPIKIDFLDGIKSKEINPNNALNIQIGNSANSSNKHIEVLDLLTKFKNENIKIYAPLSYGGDQEYAERIKNYGDKLYGEKFIPMLDYMTPQSYTDFLSDIDIAIFANERQQGLGNIFALIYLEKKVYIRSDISTWEYLAGNIGVQLFNYKDIRNEEFNNFKNIDIENYNKKNIINVMDEDTIKKKWDYIFNL